MAEGGLQPKLELHLLEWCPICLERLRQPKSLPCLHCFCQDCLGTYITKELTGKMSSVNWFPCPVCRATTTPVNPVETQQDWVKQFPANGVIQDLIQLKERSSEPLYCTPCQTKGNPSNIAKFWCKKMETSFCETCKADHHDIIHSECGILDITGYDRTGLKQKTSVPHCDVHDENKVWYCEDHQLLGCNICVFKDHRRCAEVATATEYFQKLINGYKLADMQTALKKGTEVIDLLVNDFEEQLKTMAQNQEIALQSIADLRQRVDKWLDKLQKDVTDELITSYKEEKRIIDTSLQQCERLMNSMLNTLKSSVTAVKNNDITETILLYQRGQMEVESCKELVKEMSESFTSVSIKHATFPNSVTFGVNAMGRIVIAKQPRRFPVSHDYLASPTFGRRVKRIGQFDIKTPSDKHACSARGVVYLPGDVIVVSDSHNKKLKLFTDKGQYLDELTIAGHPCDLCLVDKNTVATAVYSPGSVCVVKVEASKLSLWSKINMPYGADCLGIAHIDGRFGVSTDGGHIHSVTSSVRNFVHKYRKTCYSLTQDLVTKDVLVSVSNETEGDVAVSRITDQLVISELYKVGVLWYAAGIDVDMEGNIYVCGNRSHNVVQMSRHGKHVRELLTSSDGIINPWAIAVRGDKLVITTDIGCDVRLFKLY